MAMLTACGGGGGSGGGENTAAGGDAAGGNAAPSPVTLGGLAQKGPFMAGSEVRVAKLDAQGSIVDTRVVVGTLGEHGRLGIVPPWSGPTVVEVHGYFFDENTGDWSAYRVRLHNLVELISGQQHTGNVNLFTHLVTARSRALMAQGRSVSDALQAARAELIRTFDLRLPDGAMPDQLDLTQGDSADNANLLLFSAAVGLLADQRFIDDLALEFEEHGSLANGLAAVRPLAQGIDLNLLAANLGQLDTVANPPDGSDLNPDDLSWVTGNDTNHLPTVTNPGVQSSGEGEAVNLQIGAGDTDGDPLIYSARGLPPGLGMGASTGLIDGNVSFDAAAGSPYAVTVTVSDGSGSTDVAFSWAVTNTNRLPMVTDPGARSGAEGEAVNLQIAASDTDGDRLSYSASGLPPGLGIGAATGLISGIVGFDAAAGSPHTVTVKVSDGTGSTDVAFIWTVANTNRLPMVTDPGARSGVEGEAVNLQIAASDTDGDRLSYSARGLPPGLSIGTATGLISGIVGSDVAAGSPYAVTVTVSDGTGSVDVAFIWAVANTDHHPLAKVDHVTVDQDQTAHIDVLSNDTGLDDGGLSITIRPDAQPQHGSASVANLAVTYVPDAGFAGQDSCIYRVQDTDGDWSEASVMIQVNCTTCADGLTLFLSWDPNAMEEAVIGYRVFFGDNVATADTEIADIPVTASGLDPVAPSVQYDAEADLGLDFGDQACFRLKAYNDVGESDFSQVACATL